MAIFPRVDGRRFDRDWILIVIPAQDTAELQIVVLRNLSVLMGHVDLTDRGVRVRTADGSRLELTTSQVICLADSLDDAYRQLAKVADLNSEKDVRQLFGWCLRSGLHDRAAELIGRIQSQQTELATSLNNQLQIAIRNQKNRASVSPLPTGGSIDVAAQRKPPTEQEIAKALADLPDNAERFFNRELQPKLLAGCAAANCHDAHHQGLALWHDANFQAGARGFSHRNLYEILQWIDRDNPAASRFLEMARTPHGVPPSEALTATQTTYQRLEYWVYAISRDPSRYYSEVVAAAQEKNPSMATTDVGASSQENQPHTDDVVPAGFVESPPAPCLINR